MLGRIAFYVTCIFAGVGVYNLYNAITDWEPPVTFIEASSVTSAVPAGGQIGIRFDVDRKRICPIIKDERFIIDRNGVSRVVSNYEKVTHTRPGREVYERSITVPDDVPPGPATYFIRVYYTCTWVQRVFGPLKVESPHIPFEVLPLIPNLQGIPPELTIPVGP